MALSIQEDVARLQISMQQVSRMHVLQTFQNLVYNVPLVNVLQYICFYDSVKVSFHEVENQVDILIVFGSNYIQEFDYVLVTIEFLQKYDLSEGPLGIG